MIKVRCLRKKAYTKLRESIKDNVDLYRTGNFDYLNKDEHSYELAKEGLEIDEDFLAQISVDVENKKFREKENCLSIHEALSSIPTHIARASGFWTFLTHTHLLKYTRQRWLDQKHKEEKYLISIKNHFFADNHLRDIERNNATSRLYWMAHMCNNLDGVDQEDALDALLYDMDCRDQLIGHSTMAQSVNVRSAILKRLSCMHKGGDEKYIARKYFRPFIKDLNYQGGVTLLEGLPKKHIESLVNATMDEHISILEEETELTSISS